MHYVLFVCQCHIRDLHSRMPSQKAVSAYFTSKQMLLLGIANIYTAASQQTQHI